MRSILPADTYKVFNKAFIENKEKDRGKNNINANNNFNLQLKYSNYKATLKDNQNSNKSEITNNVKTEENKINKSTIDNNNDKKMKEIKTKNNHTLYVSINSKK